MDYPEIIFKHFKNPKNFGEINNASGIGQAGNPVCGDIMKLYIKVDKKKNRDILKRKIINIKFQTLGCVVAIGISSILTEIIKNKTIEEALKINKDDILVKMDKKLPINKIHCSCLADEALKSALNDYLQKSYKKT